MGGRDGNRKRNCLSKGNADNEGLPIRMVGGTLKRRHLAAKKEKAHNGGGRKDRESGGTSTLAVSEKVNLEVIYRTTEGRIKAVLVEKKEKVGSEREPSDSVTESLHQKTRGVSVKGPCAEGRRDSKRRPNREGSLVLKGRQR